MKYLVLTLGVWIFLLTLPGCLSQKNNRDSHACDTVVHVKKMTLDGCNMLFVLENGEKLLPVTLDEAPFELRDSQQIRVNYTRSEDMMSICMAEDFMARITCWEEIDEMN